MRGTQSARSLSTREQCVPHRKESHLNGSASTLNGKVPQLKDVPLPERAADYPKQRYMGSKHRLLSWIHSVLRTLDFETAADPFTGSGCVAYLLKVMNKRVLASDFLNFRL